MAYDPRKAQVLQQALADGLSDDEALLAAGIDPRDASSYTINTVGTPRTNPNYGRVEPSGFDRVEQSRPAPVPVPPPRPPVTRTPVSSSTTTTVQETTTGGGSRTVTVIPTTYRDTPESERLKAQADAIAAQKEARAAELRQQGKTGAEVIRDPQYRALSSEQQAALTQSQNAKAVLQEGRAVITQSDTGPAFQQTVPSTVTQNTGVVDPQIQTEQVSQLSTTGRRPEIATPPPAVSPVDPQSNQFVFDENGELIPSDSLAGRAIIAEGNAVRNSQPAAIGGEFVATQNVETGKWDVFNLADPNVPVATGLSQQAAELLAQDLSIGDPGYGLGADFAGPLPQTQAELRRQQQLDAELDAATLEAENQRAALDRARQQAAIRAQQKAQAEAGDWRVRLRLAPGATYLYNDPQPGILAPLSSNSGTDGVIFPYTPSITMAYHASYNQYDLTHSNFRGYFYQNSYLGEITLTATFTAQDTTEANYLLAVIHFFRSVTKMFYGQDAERGTPPPMVFLQGLGEFQFNLHPCLVRDFNYTLPSDVDYIRARSPNLAGVNLQLRRDRDSQPTNAFSSAIDRLRNAGLPKGGINIPPAPPTLGVNSPTYVPTKLEMTLVLLPVQTRSQVSQQFGLRKYSNGNLLKGGFW